MKFYSVLWEVTEVKFKIPREVVSTMLAKFLDPLRNPWPGVWLVSGARQANEPRLATPRDTMNSVSTQSFHSMADKIEADLNSTLKNFRKWPSTAFLGTIDVKIS